MKHLLRAALAALFITTAPAWADEIGDLSTSDASNTTRWPEGMAAGTVNDSARALEGILARWYADENCSTATTGSSNAYLFSANQTLSAYYDGLVICFDASFANTGAATLNVDSLGAKAIKKLNDQDLASGDIESGGKYLVVYDGTSFQLISPTSQGNAAVTDADNQFSAKQSIVSTDPDASEDLGLDLYRNSASPAANDQGEPIRFKFEDSAGNETTGCKVLPILLDPTDTSEDAVMRLDCQRAGSLTAGFAVGTSLYANGNTDPGAGHVDADGLLISGNEVEATKLDTAQATTSGTEFDFTSPFTNTTRAEVLFSGVSLDGTDNILVQIGDSGGVETTGYISTSGELRSADIDGTSSTAGFIVNTGTATYVLSGRMALSHLGSNVWVSSHAGKTSTIATTTGGGDRSALDSVLTTIRVTRSGTDNFDAGSVNVRWYGYD